VFDLTMALAMEASVISLSHHTVDDSAERALTAYS